jgi:uncharacterized OB-fold protein
MRNPLPVTTPATPARTYLPRYIRCAHCPAPATQEWYTPRDPAVTVTYTCDRHGVNGEPIA